MDRGYAKIAYTTGAIMSFLALLIGDMQMQIFGAALIVAGAILVKGRR